MGKLSGIAGALLLCGSLWTVAAHAQDSWVPAPPRPSVDENNVDLASGRMLLTTTDLVIGQPGAGGLTFGTAISGNGHTFSGSVDFVGNDSTKSTFIVSLGDLR